MEEVMMMLLSGRDVCHEETLNCSEGKCEPRQRLLLNECRWQQQDWRGRRTTTLRRRSCGAVTARVVIGAERRVDDAPPHRQLAGKRERERLTMLC